MALNTLLGQPSDEQIKALPSRLRNPERIQQHLDAFALHLQGVSYRGIQDHFGWKSLSTAQNSVNRGNELAKKLNLDTEKIKLKLAAAFDELADISIAEVRRQVQDGRLMTVKGPQGVELRHTAGPDPRLIGEAGRGLMRFAEFAGLTDRAPEVTSASTTLINLSAPADGASFGSKWSGETVDVASSDHVSDHSQGSTALKASDALEGPTVNKAVVVQK